MSIMATLDEIAHGIVAVLRFSPVPDPLPVDLWNHGAEEASYIARAVIDGCTAAAVPLALVKMDAAWVPGLARPSHEGVRIVGDDALQGRLEFHRQAEGGRNELHRA
jgi:hypothetical protein